VIKQTLLSFAVKTTVSPTAHKKTTTPIRGEMAEKITFVNKNTTASLTVEKNKV
jgi:hypothetical protein